MSRKLLLFTAIAVNCYFPSVFAANIPYCMALRGNGQSEPAHWGALANLFEKAGLPTAQAGGSSATITMFLVDSMAANPWISKASAADQGPRAAFLFKSLSGVSDYLIQQKNVQADLVLLQSISQVLAQSGGGDLASLEKIIASESPAQIQAQAAAVKPLISDLKKMGIGDVAPYNQVITQLENILAGGQVDASDFASLQFYTQDLYDAIRTLGSFDAADPNLFFRDGIIDFNRFSLQTGKIATFLAGVAWNAQTKSAFSKFVKDCQPGTIGKDWTDITTAKPSCQTKLSAVLDAYFGQKLNWKAINVVNGHLGSHIPTFPVVSILRDQAYTDAHNAYNQYHDQLDRSAAANFTIKNIDNVRFGYWGEPKNLTIIQQGLAKAFPNDEKSKRFYPLGSGTWLNILSVSPAEPGLASLRPIQLPDGTPGYAAGGWSDLHPVLALREFPSCQSVIYVTRTGGESLFAQGVGKRLLNFSRSWNVLEDNTPALTTANTIINDDGDPTDMTSLWSLLYNVANPVSSYMTAVRNADAVLCTNWDAYVVQNQFSELINQSYSSPFVLNPNSTAVGAALLSAGATQVTAAHLNDKDPSTGLPLWVGCH